MAFMTALSKNVYFDILNDIVDKYNNTYLRTIKIKHINVKPDSYAEYSVESNEKDSQFKVGDHVRISKYKNIFAKGYAPNWSEEVLWSTKLKTQFHVISDLNGEEIVGTFYEKELQKTNQEEFRIEKAIKRKKKKWSTSNGKAMIILLTVGLIKNTLYKMSQYFP